jgi:peptidyl-tRNA hydrolase
MRPIVKGDKLYVVVRKDLASHGAMMAQAVHVAIEFVNSHPSLTKEWYLESNYVCILEIENENELLLLVNELERKNIPCSIFTEPDLNCEWTAVAIHPSGKDVVRYLKLAGQS